MPKPVHFLDEAIEEAHAAYAWYAARSPKAAERFTQEFDRVVEEIRQGPARWPPYLHGTRFISLRRFPYLVIFRETLYSVDVIAVAHGHRKPGYWKRRLS